MSQITSKWRRDYILLVHSSTEGSVEEKKTYENIVKESALQYARLKRIPNDRMFATVLAATDMSYKHLFNPLTRDALLKMGASDKLFIFAPADDVKAGDIDAERLASKLKFAGVTKAGLITFKACDLGRGTFLEDFVRELRKLGIHIGFAKGYLGGAHTYEQYPGPTVSEEITTDDGELLEGHARYRIVGGILQTVACAHVLPEKTAQRYAEFLKGRQFS